MSPTPEALRRHLERHVGRAVSDAAWAHLEATRAIGDALDAADGGGGIEAALAELEGPLGQVETTLRADREGRRRKPRPSEVGELPPDARLRALTRIVAAKASQRDDVRAFRRSVLHGRLIKPERIGAWLERRANAQTSITRYGRVRLGADGQPSGDRMRVEPERLAYPGAGGWERAVFVDADGPLGQLKALCAALCRAFGWSEWQAVVFVLSGTVPPPSRGSWRIVRGSDQPTRIVLDVSATMPAVEVRALYERVCRLVAGERGQALQPKHAELAAFVAEVNDGRTWDAALETFNRAHPYWAYRDVRPFRRDARAAYQRVTGEALEWRSARGRGLSA